jgi:hypothetical protein
LKKSNRVSKSVIHNSVEKILTSKQLVNLVDDWQDRLHLVDWAIAVAYCTPDEMPSLQAAGSCGVDQDHKQAQICILHPKYFSPLGNSYRLRDLEHTIVHELLHIHLDGLDTPNTRDREVEQVINLVADTLLNLKYSDK